MTNINQEKQISSGTRFGTMLLDHFFMSVIAMVFCIPGMISGFSGAFSISHEQTNPVLFGGSMGYLSLLGFAIYFCKDSINGRSLAKRITKLQVVDNTTGLPASPIKCFIRNLFCILWPVEAIVALSNTGRRIGDKVAGTRLVIFDPSLPQEKFNIGQSLIAVALSYGLILLIALPFRSVLSKMEQPKVKYVETSFNANSSKETEQLLTDSLGQYLSPSIKIYDSVRGKPLKYISVICMLKENYLDNDESYEQLRQATTSLLFTRYPQNTFVGKIKYVYQGEGTMQSRTQSLGSER